VWELSFVLGPTQRTTISQYSAHMHTPHRKGPGRNTNLRTWGGATKKNSIDVVFSTRGHCQGGKTLGVRFRFPGPLSDFYGEKNLGGTGREGKIRGGKKGKDRSRRSRGGEKMLDS